MLTKQQKLDILSKAIDEGADIDVNYHKLPKKTDAKRVIDEVGEMIGLQTTHHTGGSHQWYKIESRGLDVVAFYDK